MEHLGKITSILQFSSVNVKSNTVVKKIFKYNILFDVLHSLFTYDKLLQRELFNYSFNSFSWNVQMH